MFVALLGSALEFKDNQTISFLFLAYSHAIIESPAIFEGVDLSHLCTIIYHNLANLDGQSLNLVCALARTHNQDLINLFGELPVLFHRVIFSSDSKLQKIQRLLTLI